MVQTDFHVRGATRRLLFTVVILGGSFLLFLVQPMVARMALPLLGGAPGVWNSAMLVFQVLLLSGYAYAHAISRLAFRTQASIHLSLLAASTVTLPIALADIPPPVPGWEVLWVPALFLATIGPVFLLVSAQAPLMQRWYAGIPDAGNPYRLYAASNVGSLAGLLAYPFGMEPRMALGEQGGAWALGYLVLIALIALAAASRWQVPDQLPEPGVESAAEPVRGRRLLLWLALSAVPSGLMLSTTTLLTTDLMAMPLLWVIPLGLYLLSFPVAFSDSGTWARMLGGYAPIPLLMAGGLAMISGGQANVAVALAMAALLFILSVTLHRRLYGLRPDAKYLTSFYLVVAIGGVLGGLFTALVAPVLFDRVYEHAILLLAGALLVPQRPFLPVLARFWKTGRYTTAVAVLAVAAAAVLAWQLSVAVDLGLRSRLPLLVCGLVVLGLLMVGKRWAFVAVFALLMLGYGGWSTLELSASGARSRSYFGVYTVEDRPDGLRRLLHGTTMHGEQWLVPARRTDPTSYYGRSSGAGIVLAGAGPDADVGVAGLGVGTLACYRKPGQAWTFFEIDPQVAKYSSGGTFTFLADCAPDARIVLGDARLELARVPAGRFDILVIDTFTSDAIPMHLLTEEAFDTYRRALSDEGLLLVHVSNRFIDLEPMVSALARASGWHTRIRRDDVVRARGLSASDWIVLASSEGRLEDLEDPSPRAWAKLRRASTPAWTDDKASIVQLIRF